MTRRIFLLAAFLLCLSATTAWAQEAGAQAPAQTQEQPAAAAAPQIDPEAAAAAERYMENIDIVESFDRIYDALGERLPGEHSKVIIELMKKQVRMDVVRNLILESLIAHYTLEELKALADFYGSDVGKSISRKLPDYLNDVNIAIQAEAQRAFQLAMEEVQKEAQAIAKQQQEQAEKDAAAAAEKKQGEESEAAAPAAEAETPAPEAEAPNAEGWKAKGADKQ